LKFSCQDAVYIGVDSKVIKVGTETGAVASQPKIHQGRDVVFAHAGIFKDIKGKFDVVTAAHAAIGGGGDLDKVVDRFSAAIEPQLSAVLPDIRAENAEYFKTKLKRPLEMLFASARGGSLKVIVVFFEVVDPSAGALAFRVTRVRRPGDCPSGVSTIALGEHEAADRFLDTHPEILRTRGPVAAIQEAIAAQASATPEFVLLPATLVAIDHLGIHNLK
jgi:hypothetical protein